MIDLKSTFISKLKNIEDNTETLLIGKVENIQIMSAKIKGVFIEEHFAIVNLVDLSGNVEIMLDSKRLKQLQKIGLEDTVVFKVKITDNDSFKKIDVNTVMTLDEAKRLSKKNNMDI